MGRGRVPTSGRGRAPRMKAKGGSRKGRSTSILGKGNKITDVRTAESLKREAVTSDVGYYRPANPLWAGSLVFITPPGTAHITDVLTLDYSNHEDPGGINSATGQWYVDGVKVVALSLTYTVLVADEGKRITADLLYSDDLAEDKVVPARNSVSVIPNISAGIVISPTEGTLNTVFACTPTITDPAGVNSITYQWVLGGKVVGTDSNTYTAGDVDVDTDLVCRVAYINDNAVVRGPYQSNVATVSEYVAPPGFEHDFTTDFDLTGWNTDHRASEATGRDTGGALKEYAVDEPVFIDRPESLGAFNLTTGTAPFNYARSGTVLVDDSRRQVLTVADGTPAMTGARWTGSEWSGVTAQGNPIKGMRGPMLEYAGTNLLVAPNDFTNVAWVKSGITISGSELTSTADNGTMLQTITAAAAGRMFALDIKRLSGDSWVYITADGGSSWLNVYPGEAGHVRVWIDASATNPSVGVRMDTSGSVIDLQYAAVEDDAFAGSRMDGATRPEASIFGTLSAIGVQATTNDLSLHLVTQLHCGTYGTKEYMLCEWGGLKLSILGTRLRLAKDATNLDLTLPTVDRNGVLDIRAGAFSTGMTITVNKHYAVTNADVSPLADAPYAVTFRGPQNPIHIYMGTTDTAASIPNLPMPDVPAATALRDGLLFTGDWNTGATEGGFTPMYSLSRLFEGDVWMVSFDEADVNAGDKDPDYYRAAYGMCELLNVPIMTIQQQWEQFLTGEPYLSEPIGTNPCIFDATSGLPVPYLDPMNPDKTRWGTEVGAALAAGNAMSQWMMSQSWTPPRIYVMSNNESPRYRWSSMETGDLDGNGSKRFEDAYDTGNTTDFKMITVYDGYLANFNSLIQAVRDQYSPAWQANLVIGGYNAGTGTRELGRWSAWMQYTGQAGSEDPRSYSAAFDVGSLNMYIDGGGYSDYAVRGVQVEANNTRMYVTENSQPRELLYWEAQFNHSRDSYRTDGQILTEQRFEGATQFCQWLAHGDGCREFTAHNGNAVQSQRAVNCCVRVARRVVDTPALLDWYSNGAIVLNDTETNPLNDTVPASYEARGRWWVLTCSANTPIAGWTNTTQPAVFSLAYVQGVSPNRSWMVLAQSPQSTETDVLVTIPQYQDVTVSSSPVGRFWLVEEGGATTEIVPEY